MANKFLVDTQTYGDLPWIINSLKKIFPGDKWKFNPAKFLEHIESSVLETMRGFYNSK